VATLAAQGCSNRAIAERLYITKRTVETHLTHTFQKLDVATRAQLPAVLGIATGREHTSAQLIDSR
jgi:DNA-binding NarL/FixJ family response regulator